MPVPDASGQTIISLAHQPANSRERGLVLAVAVLLLMAFVALLPFARTPLPEFNAFIPSISAVMSINDLITAALLYAQCSIAPSRGFLVLASGYLFTALIIIPHALTLPGAFTVTGLLGAGQQTSAWLFFSAHFVFPATLIGYARLKDVDRANALRSSSAGSAIGVSVVIVAALAGGFTLLTTVGNQYLPVLLFDRTHAFFVPLLTINLSIMAFATIALIELWTRRRSVLDYWLMLISVALILEEACFSISRVRFTLGYYAGRVFWLMTSIVVLLLLLREMTRLYARLARSYLLLERERNHKPLSARVITASIAHEVRQPLMAIAMNGGAAARLLSRRPLDYEEVRSALGAIVNDSQRVSQIFENIGSLFQGDSPVRQNVDLNEVAREVLQILGADLRDNSVEVRVNLAAGLPALLGHRGQLQEVVINLVTNAMDAMATNPDQSRMLLVKTERVRDDKISMTVTDSGPGISPEQRGRLFDAFVTSKSQGMGLGLAICKMIMERHGGQISVASNVASSGASFRLVLPSGLTAVAGLESESRPESA